MRWHEINEGLDDDAEHKAALDRTGFWGAQGAGCVFFAQDTRRFLLALRSNAVEQPLTYGGWGGAIDRGENPEEAVRREAYEEAGYHGSLELVPLYVFRKASFRYSNFLAVIPTEFKPRLNWEAQGFEWCEFGDWPQPLHFGIVALLNDPTSADIMQRYAAGESDQPK